ncbi:hypothetical protein EST38_g13760 [Candolleomyces aberdarensis]|uniref:J domain-containing protein n=1 Tax=Candolleomyces aberdarensis TaxID=2316362 RepID=A0A4Q2CZ49_9AGAR|nr:hypothetical protein EST38_g13760 [Candolleomyces aberdarensis]
MGQDYYKTLGVGRDACEDELKKAYKKMKLIWRLADRNPTLEEMTKMFK